MLQQYFYWKRKAESFLSGSKYWAWPVTIVALLARFAFFTYPSGDYTQFLQPWFEELKAAGGLAAIGLPVGDYMVTYLYILALLTYLPLPGIVSIKIVSCVGDLVLAIYGMRAAKLLTNSEGTARAAYTALLFLPTVLLNSGAWGQCDSLYTAALLACFYYSLRQCPKKSMLAFGAALAFKLQAIFLAPFLFYLWLQGRVKFRHFFLVPAVYLLAILPAFLAGRPLADLLTIYLRQTGTYTQLSMGAPNPYAWLGSLHVSWLTALGVALGAAAALAAVYLLCKKSTAPSPLLLIKAAYLFTLMLPFLLPRMHERYFYPADVFSVLYFYSADTPQKRVIPLITVFCSFFSSCRFLFGWTWVSPALLSLPLLCALVLLCSDTLAAAP